MKNNNYRKTIEGKYAFVDKKTAAKKARLAAKRAVKNLTTAD